MVSQGAKSGLGHHYENSEQETYPETASQDPML